MSFVDSAPLFFEPFWHSTVECCLDNSWGYILEKGVSETHLCNQACMFTQKSWCHVVTIHITLHYMNSIQNEKVTSTQIPVYIANNCSAWKFFKWRSSKNVIKLTEEADLVELTQGWPSNQQTQEGGSKQVVVILSSGARRTSQPSKRRFALRNRERGWWGTALGTQFNYRAVLASLLCKHLDDNREKLCKLTLHR